ncbi:MAG: sulfotransferase domain-containing protein [Myxococcales bacterium]|nr:sulfotransferase domain-containing protein [Myxococcales bacterium]
MPKILQIGVEKSGNYWLYQTLNAIVERAGWPNTRYVHTLPIYPLFKTWPDLSFPNQADLDCISVVRRGIWFWIPAIFHWPIEDLDDFASKTTHGWSHSPWQDPWSGRLLERFDKTVYIVRDVRDVVVSFAHFQRMPYIQRYSTLAPLGSIEEQYRDSWMARTKDWINHVLGYLAHRDQHDIHIICYERLRHDFDNELDRLLDYLGVSLSGDVKAAMASELHVSSMKKTAPGHVRKGRAGGWQAALPDDIKHGISTMAGPLLELLGYSRDEPVSPQEPSKLPRVPAALTSEEIQQVKERCHLALNAPMLDEMQAQLDVLHQALYEPNDSSPSKAKLEETIAIAGECRKLVSERLER